MAWVLCIHSMRPGPEREKELELWAFGGTLEVPPAEAALRLAADLERAGLRAAAAAWAASCPPM
ncbi:hypothetical protein ACFFSH_39235 [Streptomyces filamentosus]|uniref:Uncharacterized protein n=1 Tax=Streptomyces filamentosus TaxID=67294 RepID=A0A919BPH7_STRFL|nr:hypothetical protein [Streptomyces filamentosus]GHG05706.1 hypothetical protein GCM10017667_40740 [Streptomyces filamentosus]